MCNVLTIDKNYDKLQIKGGNKKDGKTTKN